MEKKLRQEQETRKALEMEMKHQESAIKSRELEAVKLESGRNGEVSALMVKEQEWQKERLALQERLDREMDMREAGEVFVSEARGKIAMLQGEVSRLQFGISQVATSMSRRETKKEVGDSRDAMNNGPANVPELVGGGGHSGGEDIDELQMRLQNMAEEHQHLKERTQRHALQVICLVVEQGADSAMQSSLVCWIMNHTLEKDALMHQAELDQQNHQIQQAHAGGAEEEEDEEEFADLTETERESSMLGGSAGKTEGKESREPSLAGKMGGMNIIGGDNTAATGGQSRNPRDEAKTYASELSKIKFGLRVTQFANHRREREASPPGSRPPPFPSPLPHSGSLSPGALPVSSRRSGSPLAGDLRISRNAAASAKPKFVARAVASAEKRRNSPPPKS